MATGLGRIGWLPLGAIVATLFVVVVGVLMLVRPDAEWAQVFVLASRELWRGEDIYHPGTLYLYPPFGSFLGLIFVPLPEWGVRLGFYAVNLAAIGALALASWRLAGGERLGEPSIENRRAWTAAILAAVVAAPYAWNTLLHQQADLLIDALVALGMWAALQRRSLLAGVLIGLAAAIKGPPLLFLIYFLWRRDWLAAVALVATTLGVSLLPDLVGRAPEGLWLGLWLKRIILPAADMNATLGAWASGSGYNIYNQSLGGTIQRLVNTRLVQDGADLTIAVRASLVEARPLKLLTYAIMLAMGVATFLVSFLADRRRAAIGADAATNRAAFATELAIVPLLMLLFSLMSGLAHFPIVAPAAALLARRASSGADRWAGATLAVALVVALAVNKDLVGRLLYDAFLWSGLPTLGLVALWIGCLSALLRPSPPRPLPTETNLHLRG
ncbi:MAG: DUF2029 domain-containing protein [Hyphomicrobiales bacterium]|nr:DUF2029 domain-containing protein [Hyphomicrobiales bacterium]